MTIGKLGVVAHICNPSTQETKAEGSQVPDQPGYIVRHCLKDTPLPSNLIT
jgi:hypothetical protein